MSKRDIKTNADPTPFDYEQEVYAKGLKYERPLITFDSTKWEKLAKERLSAESWGYVSSLGNHEQS